MTFFNISLSQIQIFFLVFLRVGAIMMSVPLFESKNIPILFKAGLSITISIILFPVLKLNNTPFHTEVLPFALGIAGEIMLGTIIGLSVRLIFNGIQLAGQLIGFQMGFAIVSIMDPLTSARISVIAHLNNLIATLIFLTTNAHHWFLRALAESFRLIPPFDFQFTPSLVENLMRFGTNMFIISIKVGAPVIAGLLITSVAFGLIARTVPQMHIMIVAMPLKIVLGLLFLAASLPYLSSFLKQIFNGLGRDIFLLLSTM
jgi:flagellar biosynthetic protein FliR